MSQPADPEAINVSYERGVPYATRYQGGEPDLGPTFTSGERSVDSITDQPGYQPFTLQPPPGARSGYSPYSVQPVASSPAQQFPQQLEQETLQSLSQSLSQKAVLVKPEKRTPNTFLPLAIVVTLLFCPLTGAAAIFYSLRSRQKLRIKYLGAAEGYGCISLCFSVISIVIGLTVYITLIVIAATKYRFVPYGYGNGDKLG